MPTVSAENPVVVLEETAPTPLTGRLPKLESALMFPAIYVALLVQFNPVLFAISIL